MPHHRADDQTTLTISISKDQVARLKEYASKDGSTVSNVIRNAIRIYEEHRNQKSKG